MLTYMLPGYQRGGSLYGKGYKINLINYNT